MICYSQYVCVLHLVTEIKVRLEDYILVVRSWQNIRGGRILFLPTMQYHNYIFYIYIVHVCIVICENNFHDMLVLILKRYNCPALRPYCICFNFNISYENIHIYIYILKVNAYIWVIIYSFI